MINKSKLVLVLASALLAFFFWFQTVLIKEQQSMVKLPVVFINRPITVIQSDLPTHARFRVKGIGFEIIKLRFYNVQAVLDAKTLVDNKIDITQTDYKITLPANVNVQILGLVNDAGTTLKPEISTNNYLPIEIAFENDAAKDFFYAQNFRLSQEKVEVKGSKSIIDTIERIQTQPITLEMLKKSKSTLNLMYPTDEIVLNPDKVEISKSSKYLITKVIPNVPIEKVQGYAFFPNEVTVRVRGMNTDLEALTPERVIITLKTQEETNNQIPLHITVPSGIEVIDYSPKLVSKMDANVRK